MVWIPQQPFAVSQYEVTFAQWDACVAAGGCNGLTPSDFEWGRGDRPVIHVMWEDAQAYVQWLSLRTGHRYRLLTTDEWAAAAFPGGRRQNYYWGNEEPACEPGARNGVAYAYCLPHSTRPVGSFQPNAFGLYDMLGNVREWLEDPYYEGGVARTLIGSSWRSGDALGGREQGGEIESGADIGIRVARER
jgi:formylglycine-generating enzyme required for sulfatase activity